MGLSDGERYRGVLAVVHEMYASRDHLHEYLCQPLVPLLDGLWVDLLGSTSNSMHWIMGSDSSAHYLGECSLLGAEFAEVSGEARSDQKDGGWEDTVAYWKSNFMRSAADFLDGEAKRVWELVNLCESYFYYANRYPGDELARSLAKVTATVATLRGRIHVILKSSREHYAAWMMQRIADGLFVYDEDDVVSQVARRQNWQHNLRFKQLLLAAELKKVEEVFRRYQFASNHGAEERLLDAIALMGPKYHYAHQHRELVACVERWNLLQTEIAMSNADYDPDLIDEGKLTRALEACKPQPDPYPYKAYCHLTGQSSD